MKTGIRKITYAVVEPKTYLVATLESGTEPEEFCVRMAERNQIPGLLPMHRQIDEGDVALYFDISGKRRLRDALREAGEKQLFALLSSLTRALQGLPDYFLRTGQCLLDPDCTFADSQGNVCLPLVPLKEDPQDSSALLRNYITALLGEYVPEGGTPSPKVAALIGAVIKADFTLESFAKLLAPEDGGVAARAVRREPVRETPRPAAFVPDMAPPQPAPPHQERKPSPPEPPAAAKGGFAIPGLGGASASGDVQIPGGILIPGGPAEQPSRKEKKKKEKPEKEKKSFSLLGWKKESRVDMDKEAHMVSAAAPQAVRPAPAPVMPSPAAKPDYAGDPAGGQWSGTVQLASSGATEFMDMAGAAGGAALIHNGCRITLTSVPFTVGRVNCRYVVDNPKVSRTHATILQDEEGYAIRDENSSNHTYVNGAMIPPYTPVRLEHGSEIRMGGEEFRFIQG